MHLIVEPLPYIALLVHPNVGSPPLNLIQVEITEITFTRKK